jgi:hypothetical protein
MGLDQFLMRKVEDDEDVVEIYWRKCNQIHGFFDRICGEVENCTHYPIKISQLMALKEVCQEVLDNPSLAEEKLPTMMGFFFGGYDYDEYYFDQLRYTIDQINELLERSDDSFEYYYLTWW